MSENYPLYPSLSEEAQKEAELVLNQFRDSMKKVADETIEKMYCNIIAYIETDQWSNFRNQMMDGFRNYDNRKIQGEFDFKAIREQIYKEFREDIIKDLNQDLVKENSDLKEQIEIMQRNRF